MSVFLIIALVLAGTGSLSFASENALPGDQLYPVKVNINEGARAFLSFSGEGKAELAIERVERRLEEAEKLALEGKLEESIGGSLEARLRNHLGKVNELALRLEEKGNTEAAADVRSHLESSLEAHARILAELKAKYASEALDRIAVLVAAEEDVAEAARVKAETDLTAKAQPDVQAAAEGKLSAAEAKFAEVQAFLENQKEKRGSVAGQAQTSLEGSAVLIADGKAELEEGDFGQAFVSFQQAMRTAQEAKLLSKASSELKLDLQTNTNTNAESNNENGTKINTESETEVNTEGKVELNI